MAPHSTCIAAMHGSIVCQTLAEAEAMADAGFDRILLTYPLVGHAKWARAAALASRVNLRAIGDSAAIAHGSLRSCHLRVRSGSSSSAIPASGAQECKRRRTPLPSRQRSPQIPELRLDGLLTHPAPSASQPWSRGRSSSCWKHL
jgi:hypothetical protein